jgi:hypothetical protein
MNTDPAPDDSPQRQHLERELPAFVFDDWPRETDAPYEPPNKADTGHTLTEDEARWLD